MNGDRIRCIVIREPGDDEGCYGLFIRPEGNLYFNADLLDLVREEIYQQLERCTTDGATELLLEESGEWEDVFWNRYYRTISLQEVTPDDMNAEEDRPRVSREMALDAGDPSLEGQPY